MAALALGLSSWREQRRLGVRRREADVREDKPFFLPSLDDKEWLLVRYRSLGTSG